MNLNLGFQGYRFCAQKPFAMPRLVVTTSSVHGSCWPTAVQLFERNAVIVGSDSTKGAIYSCITLARFMSFSGGIEFVKRWLFEIISLVIIGLSCIGYLKTFIGITGTEFQSEKM